MTSDIIQLENGKIEREGGITFLVLNRVTHRLKSCAQRRSSWPTKKSPAGLRFTKESMRIVRNMTKEQALDYLNCKSDALKFIDPRPIHPKGMSVANRCASKLWSHRSPSPDRWKRQSDEDA